MNSERHMAGLMAFAHRRARDIIDGLDNQSFYGDIRKLEEKGYSAYDLTIARKRVANRVSSLSRVYGTRAKNLIVEVAQ